MSEADLEQEIDLTEYLSVLLKHRKKIFALVFLSVFLTFLLSFIQPVKYEATAVFFPLDSVNQKEVTNGFTPKVNIEDLIISILKSREMSDRIIEELDLRKIWKTKFLYQAREKLKGLTRISPEKGGIIKLTIITEDPKLSAEIANAYVNGLDEFNKRLQISANVSLIQTIDRAVPPESRMARGTIKKTTTAFIISSFLSVFLALVIEWFKRNDLRNKIGMISNK